MLTDNHNRVHDYLRISLTDNCNLRCFYCMPEEDYEFTPTKHLMQADEIEAIAKTFVSQGVKKIRLTGGEPLIRKDAADIILRLSKLPITLTMTTNGTRLHDFLHVLEEANLRKLNISLDTLDAQKFLKVTRRDQFDLIMKNINLLLAKDFTIKINVVVMKDFNDNEINDFVEWTKDYPVEIRFIEFMPFTGNKWTTNQVLSLEEILHIISEKYEFLPIEAKPNDTAKHFFVPGHKGSFAVISTMTSPFCGTCNRIRLTADGKLKNCLFSKGETDLLKPYRNGEDILPLIEANIRSKAKALGGQFDNTLNTLEALAIKNRSMISIGG